MQSVVISGTAHSNKSYLVFIRALKDTFTDTGKTCQRHNGQFQKGENQCNGTRDIFYSRVLLPRQNPVSTLPTMQHNCNSAEIRLCSVSTLKPLALSRIK